MASLPADVATKVSTEAARQFVETYYPAFNHHRNQLASYYAPAGSMPDGKPIPIIVWNGNEVSDPASLQKMFEEQMPPSRYDVQSYDCHVLNPNYIPEGTSGANPASGRNMTVLLNVSGFVKYGEERSKPAQGFSESFILVPNFAAQNSRGRHTREWLIQSQTFRIVVS